MSESIVQLDKAEVRKAINNIVDVMYEIESARETINETVKELKTEYGLNPSVVRAAASAIHKRNKEELEEKNQAVLELVSLFD
jgi:uncharacterized membrane protein